MPVYSQYTSIAPVVSDCRTLLEPVMLVLSTGLAPAACNATIVIWPSSSCSSNSLEPTLICTPLSASIALIDPPPAAGAGLSLEMVQPDSAAAATRASAAASGRLGMRMVLLLA